MPTINVIIVDDSILYRTVLSSVIKRIPDTHVVATAMDGMQAIDKMRTARVDLVTLDVEMPVMDGIETLEKIRNEFPDVSVVMVSSLTKRGAEVTIKALEKGAFDFITKPAEGSREENEAFFEQQMKIIINGLQTRLTIRAMRVKDGRPNASPVTGETVLTVARSKPVPLRPSLAAYPKIVAIGSSTGGPNALTELIPRFPTGFPVPVVIVQHMPPVFTASLAESLNARSAVTVIEAKDGEELNAGTVYIAPGGMQMKVVAGEKKGKRTIKITDDPPENFCKPSVDYLFRSIAKEYRSEALGVILTGMGSDGTLGLRLMKRHNVRVIGQNAATCVVYGMPGEAKKAGVVDLELPIQEIAGEIIKTVL